ncbi:hypothetical protein Hanom_Chr06g00523661 [Helianthus anomalus]
MFFRHPMQPAETLTTPTPEPNQPNPFVADVTSVLRLDFNTMMVFQWNCINYVNGNNCLLGCLLLKHSLKTNRTIVLGFRVPKKPTACFAKFRLVNVLPLLHRHRCLLSLMVSSLWLI